MSKDLHPTADGPPTLAWHCRPFDALGVHTLYALLQLRSQIFVVEQTCIFQDMDGADASAMHVWAEQSGQLVAYARLLPPNTTFTEASIGRVVTHARARGNGLGHLLMAQALHQCETLWGKQPLRIGAQAHLQGFYRQHGFETDGAPYLEDGIAHVEMVRPAASAH